MDNLKPSLLLLIGIVSIATANAVVDYKTQPATWWQKVLSPVVYNICREEGTEQAFSGKYDHFYEKGIYYCACCGGDYPLYDSMAKFDSKTGWPSFWQPIDPQHVRLVEDKAWLVIDRIEVRCGRCDSHLGHVFDDGPPPTGKRYCMNSLTLVFFSRDQKPLRTFPEPQG